MMDGSFPAAVPEIPVSDLAKAVAYYHRQLGFSIDWNGDGGNIAGVSQGDCRLFLTDAAFREHSRLAAPIVVWLNLDSREQVDDLHARWSAGGATIVSPPASKPWGLHEFTATDPDGNRFRVFYDFGTPERERNASHEKNT